MPFFCPHIFLHGHGDGKDVDIGQKGCQKLDKRTKWKIDLGSHRLGDGRHRDREGKNKATNCTLQVQANSNRRLRLPREGQFRPLEFEARCKKMEKRSDGRKGIDRKGHAMAHSVCIDDMMEG